ncbi:MULTISPECIES: hypothetical protein [Pseudomonas]|uniref:hypothetical protein n=1 Tax=Pseudomonas TaxID=286 RepID=UPI0015A781A1|nr:MULTISPECIES: hypothetical protein [Pseudomonas]MCU1730954.1 hypothetical protein [Pseudomonas sp. 20P_3.2_Bac4]MCU1742927.1 hypothetical protein [Pseudomonas sp. 20P_3.2_Bac5]
MTIEAETLVQLTEALKKCGMNRICDIDFTRAPYREDHRWTCIVSKKSSANRVHGMRA